MNRRKAILTAKFATVLAVPLALWAFSAGPDAHHTAVPGTGEQSCNSVGCHVGTALNGGGGNVALTAVGSTYTPGQKQTFTIKITDSAARVYGFQVTARLASDRTKVAGTFAAGANQFVLCAGTSVGDAGRDRPGTGVCPASQPLEFLEHTRPLQANTITFDWTPPAAAVGAIEFYVSANAANNNGSESGDHIYTSSLTLQAASTGGTPKPTISDGGIITAAQFGAQPTIGPGTWIEVYGKDFTSNPGQGWGGADFTNGGKTAPIVLDGVSMTIGGKNAFINFITPGQINALVPDGIGTGPIQVVVTNKGVASDPVTINANAVQPGVYAPFNANGRNYVGAQLNGNFVGGPGLPAAKPGDTITLYGIGWGAVSPSIAVGNVNDQFTKLSGKLVIRMSQIDVSNIQYQGLAGGFVGLYQFNIVVPANAPDGDLPLEITIDGTPTGQTLFLAVKK